MEIFPETLKKLWNLCEIRSLVLLSLSLQIILIVFGSRRKINNPQSWISILLNVTVWCAYITADWVATVSLSVMASNDTYCGHDSSNNITSSLQAFWAPFLLLHLGGSDTITAYSLEDNELWLRHLLGLIVEVGVAFYVFLRFWSSSALTFLAIPVFITGIVKYGERTWVLWSSSTRHLKDSLASSPDGCVDLFYYDTGYEPKLVMKKGINPEDHNLVQAYYSYKRLEYLFADHIVDEFRYYNYEIISEKLAEDAFELVAIEVGLMYDVLYTKASIVYSRVGICLRCINFISSVSVLVLFFIIIDMHSYPQMDIVITYLLLIGAVVLEIYALIILFFSDWTKLWLVKIKVAPHNQMSKTLVNAFWRFTSCLHSQLSSKKRWSESIGQYNLMNSVLKKRQRTFLGLEKLSSTDKLLEKYQYLTWENVNISLQERIFKYVKEIADELHRNAQNQYYFRQSRDEQLSRRGEHALKRYVYGNSSVAKEYDARIIIWHLVTDECYQKYFNLVHSDANELEQNCKISKWLSDYMLYLLLFCPSMLPKGNGEIIYRHTYNVAMISYGMPPSKLPTRTYNWPKSVFEEASGLAFQLKHNESDWKTKWEIISEVWLEMLAYAAQNCGWKEHAQHLRKGGELLTQVSVLMANFRLSKQVM